MPGKDFNIPGQPIGSTSNLSEISGPCYNKRIYSRPNTQIDQDSNLELQENHKKKSFFSQGTTISNIGSNGSGQNMNPVNDAISEESIPDGEIPPTGDHPLRNLATLNSRITEEEYMSQPSQLSLTPAGDFPQNPQ
jgi:hypothetical protein